MRSLLDFVSDRSAAVQCRGCGEARPLRRGRCNGCYERWLRARPVGVGAVCASCGDRRLLHLRFFELHRLWVVLCHNCTARACTLEPMPRSMDALLVGLGRDRRHNERRTAAPGESGWYEAVERRRRGRRAADREPTIPVPRAEGSVVLDATDFAEMVLELEAEFDLSSEIDEVADGPITEVHLKLEPSELHA